MTEHDEVFDLRKFNILSLCYAQDVKLSRKASRQLFFIYSLVKAAKGM